MRFIHFIFSQCHNTFIKQDAVLIQRICKYSKRVWQQYHTITKCTLKQHAIQKIILAFWNAAVTEYKSFLPPNMVASNRCYVHVYTCTTLFSLIEVLHTTNCWTRTAPHTTLRRLVWTILIDVWCYMNINEIPLLSVGIV